MKNLIFIAPPSGGKGSLSELFIKHYNYEHISTGELLRNKQDDGSKLGNQIRELLTNGSLVNDEIVTELLREKLESIKGPFILDGYPRTVSQANILEDLLVNLDKKIDKVIYLDVGRDLAMKRALGRLSCPCCNKIYNKYNKLMMPKISYICDECGIELVSRSDDNEESFNHRYDTFINETKPLLDYYKNMNKLCIIDKIDNPNETFEEVKKVI